MVETFWSAGTPSRTRLRRKKKIVHTFPPPLRQPALCSASPDSLYCAGQPVLCRTACIVAAAGPPAVRAQPNGGEDDDKEAISSAATILTVCCCGYQWWTCYCCFHCCLEFRKYLVADKLQRNRSIAPPAMFLCICTMLYVVICCCWMLLLYIFVFSYCCICSISLRPSTPCQTNPPITSPAAVHRLLRRKWQPPTLVTTQQGPQTAPRLKNDRRLSHFRLSLPFGTTTTPHQSCETS